MSGISLAALRLATAEEVQMTTETLTTAPLVVSRRNSRYFEARSGGTDGRIVYLTGAEIDYREGLDGAQFVIRNPNAQTTCGCGSSFSA